MTAMRRIILFPISVEWLLWKFPGPRVQEEMKRSNASNANIAFLKITKVLPTLKNGASMIEDGG